MKTSWLAQRREDVGIESQEALAARLQLEGVNFTRAAVSHWETGRHPIPLDNPEFRHALAKVLKMSVPALLSAAGYETTVRHSSKALRAADIVDQLPPKQQELALGVLEQFLKQEA